LLCPANGEAFLALQIYLGEFKTLSFRSINFRRSWDGRAVAGLIIHEGQLTYAAAGFTKIVTSREWWNARSLPLPLGGNVLRKTYHAVQRDLLAIAARKHRLWPYSPKGRSGIRCPRARHGSTLASKFIGM
jgi:predicted solute-binding protein